MAKDVKCSVSNCIYYCKGKCEADCISVDKSCSKNAACECDTMCDTFELQK